MGSMVGKYCEELWWGSMLGKYGGELLGKLGGEEWWESMVGKYSGEVWWGSIVESMVRNYDGEL